MTRGRKSWQEIIPKYFGLAFYTTYVLHLFPFMNVLARQEGAGMKKWNLAIKKSSSYPCIVVREQILMPLDGSVNLSRSSIVLQNRASSTLALLIYQVGQSFIQRGYP